MRVLMDPFSINALSIAAYSSSLRAERFGDLVTKRTDAFLTQTTQRFSPRTVHRFFVLLAPQ